MWICGHSLFVESFWGSCDHTRLRAEMAHVWLQHSPSCSIAAKYGQWEWKILRLFTFSYTNLGCILYVHRAYKISHVVQNAQRAFKISSQNVHTLVRPCSLPSITDIHLAACVLNGVNKGNLIKSNLNWYSNKRIWSSPRIYRLRRWKKEWLL